MAFKRAGDERFASRERLRGRRDFARVFRVRCRCADACLAIHVVAGERSHSRLGISVSKRVGNAVQRNYLRRRVREAYRKMSANLPPGYDIVCIVQPGAVESPDDIPGSLKALITKATVRWAARAAGNRPRHADPSAPQ